MSIIRLFLFIVLLVLIETVLVPLPLSFIALFLWLTFYSKEQALLLAFLAGLLFDILLLRTLGTTAMLFIVLLSVASLYRQKYETYNLFFLGIAVFLSILVLEFTYSKTIALPSALFGMLLTMLLGKVYVPSSQKYESWYRVS